MAVDPRDVLKSVDLAGLRIVHYPDPCLAKVAQELSEAYDSLAPLCDRMFELMFQARGVGLAAPQVGLSIRLFVATPSGEEADRRVYINPQLLGTEGKQEEEEGCLSVPGVGCSIKRYRTVTIQAIGLDGKPFEETGVDLAARVYQHETDHLEGTLILDRMGSVARMANRKSIRELEDEFPST